MQCPCHSNILYANCCEKFHLGKTLPNPVELMRSRYSAFCLLLENYLYKTWHISTRPQNLDLDKNIKWIGLEIKYSNITDRNAIVEFIARGKSNGKAFRLHEASNFVLEDKWYYIYGLIK